MAVAASAPPRGVMIDIGGRALRLVCEGTRVDDGPTVLFEAGSFGTGADWAAVQAKIAPRLRSCAYDRAGLGYSDPGPTPRDSLHVASDLEQLLARAGERGPFVLVAHSMAPVHAYVFARRNPGLVAGLVLVDAVPPEAMRNQGVARWVAGFGRATAIAPLGVRLGARLGILRLLQGLGGDAIGLPEPARSEKRHAFGSTRHTVWAAAEAQLWPRDGEQARALGDIDPALPVAAISAGPRQENWKRMQAMPALRAEHGYVEHVEAANHTSLLGPRYNDAIVRGIDFVREAAAKVASTPSAGR